MELITFLQRFLKNISNFETLKDIGALCFDDGYEDIFAIKDFYNTSKIKPVIFSVTEFINEYNDWDVNFFINKKKHLNIEQIKYLVSRGWIIRCGQSHNDYKVLDNREIYNDERI